MVQQPVIKGVLFRRAFREHPGQEPEDGVNQHHGGQFPATDDKVADANFFIHPVLDDALVHPFVVAAQQDQPRFGGQLQNSCLSQRLALGGQVDHVSALGPDVAHGLK
jgi:hypothetical protein